MPENPNSVLPLVPVALDSAQDVLAIALAQYLAPELKSGMLALPLAISIMAGLQRAIASNDARAAVQHWEESKKAAKEHLKRYKPARKRYTQEDVDLVLELYKKPGTSFASVARSVRIPVGTVQRMLDGKYKVRS